MECGSVTLSVETDATSEQLWASWKNARTNVDDAGRLMGEAAERWRQATDPVTRQRLWVEREAAARQFQLISACADLYYAAFIFSTDGAASAPQVGPNCWLIQVGSAPPS